MRRDNTPLAGGEIQAQEIKHYNDIYIPVTCLPKMAKALAVGTGFDSPADLRDAIKSEMNSWKGKEKAHVESTHTQPGIGVWCNTCGVSVDVFIGQVSHEA